MSFLRDSGKCHEPTHAVLVLATAVAACAVVRRQFGEAVGAVAKLLARLAQFLEHQLADVMRAALAGLGLERIARVKVA